MTELDLYKKLYSKVVCDTDKILQEIHKSLANQNFGWKVLNDFYKKLHQVLLDAEEIFMDAEDVEEGEGGDGLQYITGLGITELGNCVERAAQSVCADMPNSEQLAQKVKEKFEEEMRQWKEELRESEGGDYEGGGTVHGESSSDALYEAMLAESLAYDEEFHRIMTEKFEKKRREQEKQRQDTENEKAENQET